MRICIDVSPAVHHRGGIGRYVEELVPALRGVEPEDEYLGLCDRAGRALADAGPGGVPLVSHGLPDRAWRLLALASLRSGIPVGADFGGAEILHATDNVLPRTRRAATVITLHDLAFRVCPETHQTLNRRYLQLAMGPMLRTADAVIAISEATARDAVRLYGVDAERLHVIHDGVEARFHPVDPEEVARVRTIYALPERYLLFVGTIEPRKNLIVLLRAYAALCAEGTVPPLVLVGKAGWLSEPFFEARRRAGLEDKVRVLGHVPEGDLVPLYSAAGLFVLPSLYEGFGLPILEAMACGAPVICSDSSSLPEVAGDAALVVPVNDVGALAGAMRRILEDESLCRRLRGQGLRRAAEFTWERTARETRRVYERVYARMNARARDSRLGRPA